MPDLKSSVLAAALAGAESAAASPAIPMDPAAVRPVAEVIAAKVAPVIAHATNAEPWYQSRVLLGSIATIVTSAFGLYALWTAGITDGELYAPPIGAIMGAAVAIYGRLIASKPLGQ